MTKVLVTLDFDGTVSPIDHDYDFKNDEAYNVYRLGAFPCAISHEVETFLKDLKSAESEDVITVWASSWEDMTEFFHKDSEGNIPEFPYLPLELEVTAKAEAILKFAVEQNVDVVHVFEDALEVGDDIKRIMKENPEKYSFEVVFHLCKLNTGITGKMVEQVKNAIRP